MNQKIVKVTANIGTDGPYCYWCRYFENGGQFCQLFQARLYLDPDHRPLRDVACLEAESENRQMGLGL